MTDNMIKKRKKDTHIRLVTRDTGTKGQRIDLAWGTLQGKGNDNTPSLCMHYTHYTKAPGSLVPSSHLSSHVTQVNKPISTRQNTNIVTTGRKPKKFLRRVRRHPSALGQEGPHRMGGGRAGQGASSSGKGQHVALEKRRY